MSPPESELPQQCPVTECPKHPSPLHFSINVTVPGELSGRTRGETMATKCAINGRQWGAYDGRRHTRSTRCCEPGSTPKTIIPTTRVRRPHAHSSMNVPRTTVYGHLNTQHPGCEFVGCTGEHGGLRSLLWRCCRRGSASAATSRAPEPKTPTNARTFLVRSSPDLIATSANRRRPSMSRARCAATGRILAGDLAQAAHSGDGFPDPVRRWLTASGWTVPSELRCPDHA